MKTSESPSGTTGLMASSWSRWDVRRVATKRGRGIDAADAAVFVSTSTAIGPDRESCWRTVTTM
jgi:hypothetical protein